jgi:hypothetical protein
LEQLIYQMLAANDVVGAETLWNERGFFETYFGLVDAWPNAPDNARLIAMSGIVAGALYKSALMKPYLNIVLRWLEQAPLGSVLDRIAPAVFKRLGETERLTAWLKRAHSGADAAYTAWLARVQAG